MPPHDRFGLQYLLGLSIQELQVVFRILNNTDRSEKGFTKCLETIQKERNSDMATPAMVTARPEQRLFFCVLGPDDVKHADTAIITEILLRVQATTGHFKDTDSLFKLLVHVTPSSMMIKNRDSTSDDTAYCFVRLSVSMGLVSMMTLESMVEDLIIHESTTNNSMLLRIQDPLDDSLEGQFVLHANRHVGSRNIKYLTVDMTGFPSNDLLNRCVFFITSALEAKIRPHQQHAATSIHCKNVRSSPAHRRTDA
jgi:hypothetical protein